MDKINSAINRLGKKLFADMEESRRRELSIRIAAGILIALICMTGVGVFRYRAERELRQYQRIADSFRQIDILIEETEQ